MKKKNWYKLDSVGKFYASIASKQVSDVFRYSVILIDEIDENSLQEALKNTIEIYPNFNVNLKKGFFWYYLDETNKIPKVTKENLPICFKIYNNDDDFLYRVSYYRNKINFEVSHILSDGRGSVEFFKVLVSNYIKIKYDLENIKISTNNSSLEKSEDSFVKYYKKTTKYSVKRPKIYMYKGKKIKNQTRFMECHINTKNILALAHKYKCTLTSFLVSVLIYSFKDELSIKEYKKNIKIDIPVDLRTFFKSTSSKNFFGLTNVIYKFKNREDTLEDVIESVNKQFKENITAEKLSERANLMVSFEKNWFCRITPILLKNYVLKIIDYFTSQMSTTCLSNIGIINFDKNIEDKIKSTSVLTSTNTFQFTICSFKDDVTIGISNKFKYNDVIKNFCRFLSDNGLNINIDFSEVD